MKIGLTANPRKPAAIEIAHRALQLIGDRAEVVLSDESAPLSPPPRTAPSRTSTRTS